MITTKTAKNLKLSLLRVFSDASISKKENCSKWKDHSKSKLNYTRRRSKNEIDFKSRVNLNLMRS